MAIEETLKNMEKEQIKEEFIEEMSEEQSKIEDTTNNQGMWVGDIQEVKTMNIYQKLTYIQNELLETSIPKNGKNPFGGFKYYELEDLLPPILKLCKKYGCTLYFNFPSVEGNCYKGVLNLINWDDTSDVIKVEVPFPQLEKLPKMNYAQVSGTYQTYMKRYLILHTFDIVEKEVIDSGFSDENNKKTNTFKKNNSTSSKSTVTPKKTIPKKQGSNIKKEKVTSNKKEDKKVKTSSGRPECLQKVIDKCKEEYPDKECDWKLLNRVSLKMFNNEELTLDERKAVFEYIKTLR